MESVLQFPTLQRLSAVTIVAHAWSRQDAWTLLTEIPEMTNIQSVLQLVKSLFAEANYPASSSKKKWLDMEDKVVAQISALPAPKVTKKQLANLVKPLGREIFHFYGFYLLKDEHYFDYIMDSPEPVAPSICWSVWGTVDWKTSAEQYVKDETLNVEARYRFACLNYLEEDICKLLHGISEDYRNSLLGDNYLDEPDQSSENMLVAHWTRSIVSGENSFMRRNRVYSYVIPNCTPAAYEVCFENLSQEMKVNFWKYIQLIWFGKYYYLIRSVPYFWLLLNHMEEEELFNACKIWYLLNCMLCWPWQPLFLETAKRASRFMNENDFSHVLDGIARVILAGFKDYDYEQLLREFRQLRPEETVGETVEET